MRKRVYWITLVQLVYKLCRYWVRYKGKMPDDLPDSIKVALDALELICEALLAYDKIRPRGKAE